MSGALNWTVAEFETLLGMPRASDDEAARACGRTPGGVAAVREGIHDYHNAGNFSALSTMMRQRLQDTSRSVECPRCGQTI